MEAQHSLTGAPPLVDADEAGHAPVGKTRARHEVGLVLVVGCAFLLALVTEWLAQFFLGELSDPFSLATLALMAAPLLLTYIAIAISLARRPLWLRVSIAIFLLLVPPALVFSGAFHG